MTRFLSLCAMLALAACQAGFGSPPGGPLDEVERLSEVEVVDAETPAIAGTAAPDGAALLGGLLSGLTAGTASAPRKGPDAADVPPATQQPLGTISRTCGLPQSSLGTAIAKVSGYTLYDTVPNATAPRPHYVTGFSDGCARQFSAALATFGDVGTHELIRYAQTRVSLDYSATDQAYEAIKSRFCRVGFRQPCGNRIDALARRTTFLTAYPSFGGAGKWAEYLLSDGAVTAAAIESP